MDLATFTASLADSTPPSGLSAPLLASVARRAGRVGHCSRHRPAREGDPAHDWVHAHLHRVEGDLGNAGYWYRRAGKPMPTGDLASEREAIIAALLSQD